MSKTVFSLRWLTRLLAGAALLTTTVTLPAQIVFTVTGTANNSLAGYSLGSPYTFTFTSQTSFVPNVDSSFGPTSNYWAEEDATESQVWSTVTGGNLTGSYTRPSAGDTSAFLQVENTPALSFGAGVDDGSGANIGLVTPNTTLVGSIVVSLTGGTLPNFTQGNRFADPVTYFANFNGTYSGFSGGVLTLKNTSNTPLVSFAVTSFTINATAVPEPSVYAFAVGSIALGLATWRRRRNAETRHE